MTNTIANGKTLALLVLAIAMAGCTSAPEVKELAKTTATNASLVSTQLAVFEKNNVRISVYRADAAAALADEVERQQATFDAYLEGARAAAAIAGQAKQPNYGTTVVELQRVSDAVQARQRVAAARRAGAREEIVASRATLDLPKESLGSISKQLGKLADEPSREAQLEFLGKFFAQIGNDIENAKEASEGAAVKSRSTASGANDAVKTPQTGS